MKAKRSNIITSVRAALLASLFIVSINSSAQDTKLQHSIDTVSQAIAELDLKAEACIIALDSGADTEQNCNDFLTAIDGELMAGYIRECRNLKQWRNEFVNKSVLNNSDLSTTDDEEMLRRLIAIEFNCGESTLQDRTEYVVSAFSRLQSDSSRSELSSGSGLAPAILIRQLSERRFNDIEERERLRLQNAVQNQQSRSQLETERQFNTLENELLRQQIQRPNRF